MIQVLHAARFLELVTDGRWEFVRRRNASAVVGIIAMLFSGYIADKVGRRTLLAGSAIAIAVFSGFAPQMLDGGLVGELAFMILGFILLGLSLGQSSGSVASSFRKRYRYTASALTTDLAWLFGAGFAPLAALPPGRN